MDEEVQGEAPSEDNPTLAQLTKVYIKMRDAKERIQTECDKQVADIVQQMAMVEEQMLETCKQFNADSIRTPYGTIVRSVKSRYWTNDWDSMHRFIAEHHAFGLLEKRLHQTHMKEFLSENPDLLPVGLNVESAYTVVVRRSKGS
jgi:hypothetical protein